jgi:outer membrane receptor protein involved in Fe transport
LIPLRQQLLNAILAANSFPALPTRQLNPGFSPSHRAETEASGRLDHQLRKNTVTFRYSFNNNREAGGAFNAGALNDASMRGSSFAEDHTLIGGLTSLLGQSTVNDAHFQASTRRVVLRSNQVLGPEIDIVGVARFGRPYDGNLGRHENHFEFADSVTVSKGHHLFKFGGGLDHIHENLQSFDGTGGLYTFLSLPDFAAGRAYQYRQRFGSPSAIQGVTKLSIFAQDHWKLTQHLTADLGLRYDYEKLPGRFNDDANNLAPRLGLAFSPWANWVFRGGFGVFYDRYPLAFLSEALLNDGRTGFEQVVDLGSAATVFLSHSGGSPVSPLAGPISVYQAEPDLRTAYSEQANVGVEHLIFHGDLGVSTYD